MRYSFVMAVFLACLQCACAGRNQRASEHILIAVSQAGGGWEQDDAISIGGAEFGGTVLLSVNDNPVHLMDSGGHMLDITPWIQAGTNCVVVSGATTTNLYVKLISAEGQMQNRRLLCKYIVPPGAAFSNRAEFAAPGNWTSPIFKGADLVLSEALTNEIRAAVAELDKQLREGRREEFKERVTTGLRMWGAAMYGNEQLKTVMAERGGDLLPDMRGATASKEALRIFIGKKAAYVYSGMDGPSFLRSPHLLMYTNSTGPTVSIPPIRLIRNGDRLIVWE